MAKGIKQYKYKEFHNNIGYIGSAEVSEQLNAWLQKNPQIIIHDIKYCGYGTRNHSYRSALVEYEEVALTVNVHKYDDVKAMQVYMPVS